MPNSRTYFRFQDQTGGIDLYVAREDATVNDEETFELPIQDAALTKVMLKKRSLELQPKGVNESVLTAIANRVDDAVTDLINQTYTGFTLDLGAVQLFDLVPVSYGYSVPEAVNGIRVWTEGVSIKYTTRNFS